MSNLASLPETERYRFLYVGMDIHKDSHTAVALNCFGQRILELKIANSTDDFDNLIEKVSQVSKEKNLVPVFGLEDSFGYGARLARHLFEKQMPVKMVPMKHNRQA